MFVREYTLSQEKAGPAGSGFGYIMGGAWHAYERAVDSAWYAV